MWPSEAVARSGVVAEHVHAIQRAWERGGESFVARLGVCKEARRIASEDQLRERGEEQEGGGRLVAFLVETRGRAEVRAARCGGEVEAVAGRESRKRSLRRAAAPDGAQNLADSMADDGGALHPSDLEPVAAAEPDAMLDGATARIAAALADWELRSGGEAFRWCGIPYREALAVEARLADDKEVERVRSRVRRAL